MIGAMAYEHILVEIDAPIATITLNRPKVLNALSPALIGELTGALAELDADPNVHAAVLTGGPKVFAAGADISDMAGGGARLGQPEINLGIIPGAGGTQRWPRTAGKYVAMEVMLTGAPVTAQRAYELGIVNKVVPAEATITIAQRLAREIAEKPPLAVRMAKEAVLKAFEAPLSEGLASERKSFYFLFATEDQKEGMHAFLEKRKGVFRGR